jgi:thiamine biosynthesis lipoprotein
MIQSTRFEALGCEVRLAVLDGRLANAEGAARRTLKQVDETYSRFRPDSELSLLNARPEEDVVVSSLLGKAIDVALRAAVETDGVVDPTVGRAMRLIGYDDDFARIRGRTERIVLRLERVPGLKAVRFDEATRSIRIRRGVELDLGSTGKALASELAAEAAMADGRARGVLVSVGGDVAMAGEAPPTGWNVLIADDSRALIDGPGERIALHTGAIATSSTSVRRWARGDVELHHIIDPRTGLPATTPWRTATVVADRCVWANAAATASIVLGESAIAWLEGRGLAARLVANDGSVAVSRDWPLPQGAAA